MHQEQSDKDLNCLPFDLYGLKAFLNSQGHFVLFIGQLHQYFGCLKIKDFYNKYKMVCNIVTI